MLLLDWLKSLRARFRSSRKFDKSLRRRKLQRQIQLHSESLEERLMLDGDLPMAMMYGVSIDYQHGTGGGSFSDGSVAMWEGGTATATVVVMAELTTTVTVNYQVAVADGPAQVLGSGVLTFGPNNYSQSFQYVSTDNSVDEPTRSVRMSISAGDGTTVNSQYYNSGVVRILDDDYDASLAFTTVVNVSVPESVGSIDNSVLNLGLGNYVTGPGTTYSVTQDGTATGGYDYSSGFGLWTTGQDPNQVSGSIPIVNDLRDEPDETFTVDFSYMDQWGSNLFAPNTVRYVVTIVDDDAAPTVDLVYYSGWQHGAPVPSGANTITEGMSGSYYIALSQPSEKEITVTLETQAGTAVSGDDYTAISTTITIPASLPSESVTTPYGGIVNTLDDQQPESDETFGVSLLSATNATIIGNVLGFTITDNDTAPPPPPPPPTPTPPVFSQSAYTFNVHETAPTGTIVGTVMATGAMGPNGVPDTVSYSGGSYPFMIDSTGNIVLMSGGLLDYETTGPDHDVTFDVIATDSQGQTATAEVVVHILDDNEQPILNPIADINITVGDSVIITPSAIDPDIGETLTYTASGEIWLEGYQWWYGEAMILDNGVPLGSFRIIPLVAHAGQTFQASITVHDHLGVTNTQTFSITVNPVTPGQITSPGTVFEIDEFSDWSIDLSATPAYYLAYPGSQQHGIWTFDHIDVTDLRNGQYGYVAPFAITEIGTNLARLEFFPGESNAEELWLLPVHYRTMVHTRFDEWLDTSVTIAVQVNEVNSLPTLDISDVSSDGSVTIVAGTELALNLVASDEDLPVTGLEFFTDYTTAPYAQGLTVQNVQQTLDQWGRRQATAELVWPSSQTQIPGTYSIEIRVSDGYGSTTRILTIHVVSPVISKNHPPRFDSEPVVDAEVGVPYQYVLRALDPDDDPLTYSLVAGPAGLELGGNNLDTLTWSNPNAALLNQHVPVTVRVTDSHGAFADQAFEIWMHPNSQNLAPVITSIPPVELLLPEDHLVHVGDVQPQHLYVESSATETVTQHVSINIGALPPSLKSYDQVDVFFLLDDTGSMEDRLTVASDALPDIILQLQASFPGIDFGFGVGRFEDYGGSFGSPYTIGTVAADRPFILNQPIITTTTEGFDDSISDALQRTSPGAGGDFPESYLEALYQIATGAGFDGDGNGRTDGLPQGASETDPNRQAAGSLATQQDPNSTGDVPAFSSFSADPTNHILAPAGSLGGVGFRQNALKLVLLATDAGLAFEPEIVPTSIITSAYGPIPMSQFVVAGAPDISRGWTPDGRGARIQETIDALNALDVHVVPLNAGDLRFTEYVVNGVMHEFVMPDPAMELRAIAAATGAINYGTTTLDSNFPSEAFPGAIIDPSQDILPNDPLHFWIPTDPLVLAALSSSSLASQVAIAAGSAIFASVAHAPIDVRVTAEDPAFIASANNIAHRVLDYTTASFDVDLQPSGLPRTFPLQFINDETGELIGSIPVSIGNHYYYLAEATDPEGDTLTWHLDTPLAGAVLTDVAPGKALLQWMPEAPGVYQFQLTVTDPQGGATTQNFSVTVTESAVGSPPIFAPLPELTATLSHPWTQQMVADDPSGGPVRYYLQNPVDGMSIDPRTGAISWTPIDDPNDNVTYPSDVSVTVLAYSVSGAWAEANLTIHVVPSSVNQPPRMTSHPVTSALVGHTWTYQLSAADADFDPYDFVIQTKPSNAVFDATTGTLVWTPLADQVGVNSFSIRVTDAQGAWTTQTFNVRARFPNRAPLIFADSAIEAFSDESRYMQIGAADPDAGDSCTVSIDDASLSHGFEFDAENSMLTWSRLPAGIYHVRITATDNHDLASEHELTVTIRDLPTVSFTTTPATISGVNQLWTYSPVAVDDTGRVIPVVLSTDIELPNWLTFTDGVASGTPAAPTEVELEFWAIDNTRIVAAQTFTLTITESGVDGHWPEWTSVPIGPAFVGTEWKYYLEASDADVGDTLTYALVIAPDDVSVGIAALLTDIDGRKYISWTPELAAVNESFEFKVTVQDQTGLGQWQSFSLRVEAEPDEEFAPQFDSVPVVRVIAGQNYLYHPHAVAENNASVTYALLEHPADMVLTGNGDIVWSPDRVRVADVVVEARDPEGRTSRQSFRIQVVADPANHAPVITSQTPPKAFLGEEWVFPLSAIDADGDRVRYQLMSGPEGMTLGADNTIRWTPIDTATEEFIFLAYDGRGGLDGGWITLPVNINRPPYFDQEPTETTLLVDVTTSYEFTVYDPNDGPSITGDERITLSLDPISRALGMTLTSSPAGTGGDDSLLGSFTWTPTLDDVGSHRVTITARDSHGAHAVQTFELFVRQNHAPEILPNQPAQTSEPAAITRTAIAGQVWKYAPNARDVDGDYLTLSFVENTTHPSEMSIYTHPVTGAMMLMWTPTETTTEPIEVHIQVSDAYGGSAVQTVFVNVVAQGGGGGNGDNQAPEWNSAPVGPAYVGFLWEYQLAATDPEGQPLTYSVMSAPDGTSGLSIDDSNKLTWVPAHDGNYRIGLAVFDGTLHSYQQFDLPVTHLNQPPQLLSVPYDPLVGSEWTYQVIGVDPDHDFLKYSFQAFQKSPVSGAEDVDISRDFAFDANHVLRYTPTVESVGLPIKLTIKLDDGHGGEAEDTVILKVTQPVSPVPQGSTDPNKPPFVVSVPSHQAFAGEVWSYQILAVDPDGDSRTIEFFPDDQYVIPGLEIDNRTGVLTWDLTDPSSYSGLQLENVYSMGVRLRDADGRETVYRFPIRLSAINQAPVITSVPQGPAFVNRTWIYQLEVADPNGDPLYFSVDKASAAAGITVDTNGLVMWTPTAAMAGRPIVVFVSDREGTVNELPDINASGSAQEDSAARPFWAQQGFVLPVSNAIPDSETPVITSLPPSTIRTNLPLQYQVVAHDPSGEVLTYSLVGTIPDLPTENYFQINAATGLVTLHDIPTNDDIGNFELTIQVENPGHQIAQQRFKISVVAPYKLNEPPAITVPPEVVGYRDLAFEYQVDAVDPNSDDLLTYRLIDAPRWISMDTQGRLTGTPRASGLYSVTVSVSDGDFSDEQTLTITIQNNAAPQMGALSDRLVELGSSLTVPLNATDPNPGDQLTYRLEEAPVGLVLSQDASGNWQLTWSSADIQAAGKGRYRVTLVVADQHQASLVQSFDVQVIEHDVNEVPVIDNSPRTNIPAGYQFIHYVFAHDPDGDLLTYTLVTGPVGATLDAEGILTWRPTVAQVSNAGYDFVVQVADARGATVTATWHVIVTTSLINSDPVITSTPKHSATVGYQFSYQPVAADADQDLLLWKLDAGSPVGMRIDPLSGRLTWTPTAAQVGSTTVTIRVFDPYGGVTSQQISLTVRGANLPPLIDSDPPVLVELGQTYQYQAVAHDPDEGDLTYALTAYPSGMTISATGLTIWNTTNATAGAYDVSVRVTDDRGATVEQTYQVKVYDPAINRPPVFDSTPPAYALIGDEYVYQPHATDAPGETVIYGLGDTALDLGMTMDALTGRITWTPVAADAGTYLISITATDLTANTNDSLTVIQSYELVVRTNAAPTLAVIPDQSFTAGLPFDYDLDAADSDGDLLTYSVSSVPTLSGMTVDAKGHLHWASTVANGGLDYVITVNVADGIGGSVSKSFTISVRQDLERPDVAIQFQPPQLVLTRQGQVHVESSDNVGVDSLVLTLVAKPAEDQLHELNDAFSLVNGSILFTGTALGDYVFEAVATDARGNSRTVQATLSVIPDTFAPQITITNLRDRQVLTEPLDILGTIDDADSDSVTYTLTYQAEGGAPVTFASGSSELRGGVLGHFDPTVLSNGVYTITVTATDGLGNMSFVTRSVQVSGRLKLGNFTLGATDLQINTVGIPLTVGRTYDSLNADKDLDFGYGWKLNFSIPTAVVNYSQYELSSTGDYPTFTDGTRIVVTLSDGTTAGFTFTPYKVIRNGLGADWGVTEYKPYFLPDPGVQSQLWVENFNEITLAKPAGSEEYFVSALTGVSSGFGIGQAYNPVAANSPSHVKLALVDHSGNSIFFNAEQATGQTASAWIQDRQGNRITYEDVSATETTVTYSRVINVTGDHNDPNNRTSGISGTRQIVIERADGHHVSSIYNRDDAAHPITFVYNTNGELWNVIGQGQTNPTTYGYDEDLLHYLTSITDPEGRQMSTIHYADDPTTPQADYRVSSTVDNAGVQSSYDYTLANGTYTQSINIVDSTPAGSANDDGNDTSSQATITLDKRGDPIQQQSAGGPTIVSHYDSSGNVLNQTQVIGQLDSVENGEHDDITQKMSYDRWGEAVSSTSPTGQVNRMSYDAQGNVIGSTDPLGNVTRYDYRSTEIVNGQTATIDYAKYGLIQSATANGQTTNFTYDAQGNLLTVRSASAVPEAAPLIENYYDSFGQLMWTKGATGQRVEYEYDAYGNRSATKRWLGTTMVDNVEVANGMVIDHTVLDDAGRVTATWQEQFAPGASVSEVLRRTETVYNAAGQVVSVTSYVGNLSTTAVQTDLIATSYSETLHDRRGLQIESRSKSGAAGAVWTVTRSVYDDLGRVIFSSDSYQEGANPVIKGTRTYYDALGHVLRTEQRTGVVITISNPADEQTRSASIATEADWGSVQADDSTTYDAQGRVTSSTDQYGFLSETRYDVRGNVTESRYQALTADDDLVWLVSRMIYNDKGQVVISTDQFREDAATTSGTRSIYDAQGRVIRTERLAGIVVSIDANNKTSLTERGSVVSVSETHYNAKGQMESTVAAHAPGIIAADKAVTSYFYDELGRQEYVFGPAMTIGSERLRLVSQTVYDDAHQGRRLAEVTNLRVSETGGIADIVATFAHTATFSYDELGNADGTTYTAAEHSNVLISTHSEFDAIGHLISETDALGHIKTFEYDPISGQLTKVTLPQVWDPISQQNQNPVYQYRYDDQGNLVQIIDPLGHETHFTFNDQGQQLTRTLPLGFGLDGILGTSDDTAVPAGDFTEHAEYDDRGRQTLAIDFEGHVTRFVYDDTPTTAHPMVTGRLIGKQFFDNSTQYANGTGTPAETVSYQYDEFGRVTVVSTVRRDPLTGDPRPAEDVVTAYDSNGRVSRISAPQGVINYEYSPVTGQMTRTWTGADSESVVNDFGYVYDKLGRLSTVTVVRRNGQTLTTSEVTSYTYDLLGNLVRLDASNGDVTEYVYDGFNRLTRLTNYAPDGTSADLSNNPKLSEFVYDVREDGSRSAAHESFWAQDANGNLVLDRTQDIVWTYDALDRLTEEDFNSSVDADDFTATYVFDLTGNRLTKTTDTGRNSTIDLKIDYGYDANDRLSVENQDDASTVASVDQQITYDYDHTTQTGKRTEVNDVNGVMGVTTSQVTYTYNVQGRLASAVIKEYTSGAETSRTTASYTYDDTGIRITATERILIDADQDPQTELTEYSFTSTEYLNAPQNLTGYSQVLQEMERDATGQIIKTIVSTLGLDVLAQATYGQSFPAEGQALVLLYDGHGSTRMLANAAGLLAIIASTPQQFHYDAYGNATGFNPANAATNLLYSGEQWDQRVDMQYLRARYYDPLSGRLAGLDPYSGRKITPQSFHKYLYTQGNPINGTDPSGEMTLGSTLAGMAISTGRFAYENRGVLAFTVPLLGFSGFGAINSMVGLVNGQMDVETAAASWARYTLFGAAFGGGAAFVVTGQFALMIAACGLGGIKASGLGFGAMVGSEVIAAFTAMYSADGVGKLMDGFAQLYYGTKSAIRRYKNEIRAAATEAGVPAELVAAVLLSELRAIDLGDQFLDSEQFLKPREHSIGMAQLRIDNVTNWKLFLPEWYTKLGATSSKHVPSSVIRASLLTPKLAIRLLAYAVKHFDSMGPHPGTQIAKPDLGQWNTYSEGRKQFIADLFAGAKDEITGHLVSGGLDGYGSMEMILNEHLLD